MAEQLVSHIRLTYITLNNLGHTEQLVSHIWLTYGSYLSHCLAYITLNNLCHTYGSHMSQCLTYITLNKFCLTYGSHTAHVCDTVSHMSRSTTCVCHTKQVVAHIWQKHFSHMKEQCLAYDWCVVSCMWLLQKSSIKETIFCKRNLYFEVVSGVILMCCVSHVTFAKELYKRDYVLQKKPIYWGSVWRMTDAFCLACNFCKRAL